MTEQDYNQITQLFEQQDWQRTHFDGGQSHLMGWTIMSVWELDKAKITLHHSERYNEVTYDIEANPLGVKWLKAQDMAHVLEG